MIKLFTHRDDPDGVGSVILTRMLTEDFDFTLCKGTKELDEHIKVFLKNQECKNYDQVFITDLCPSDKTLQEIEKDQNLSEKFKVFDHHQSSMDEMTKKYSFVTSMVKKKDMSCCGTSLYYEYLLNETKNALLQKKSVMEFVEKTRLHDTWEWKKENDLIAFHLQTLFQVLGPYGYYYHFFDKLSKADDFSYTKQEENWIKTQERTNQQLIEDLAKKISSKSYQNHQVGIVFGSYSVRNNLAEYLIEKRKDLDILMLIAVDNQSVSFRSLKDDVEVRSLAEKYGGGGHEKAASCLFQDIEPLLLERVLK